MEAKAGEQYGMILIPIPKVLRGKLGNDGSEELVKMINNAIHASHTNAIKFTEHATEKQVTVLNPELVKYMGGVEARLTKYLAEMESRLTWKMLGFWVGQFLLMLALFGFFFHLIK